MSQVQQLPSALVGVRGMEHLLNAAERGCCTAAEREAVWTAVHSTADDVGRLSGPLSREVWLLCITDGVMKRRDWHSLL